MSVKSGVPGGTRHPDFVEIASTSGNTKITTGQSSVVEQRSPDIQFVHRIVGLIPPLMSGRDMGTALSVGSIFGELNFVRVRQTIDYV